MKRPRSSILVCAAMVLISHPAKADLWYEHYANAQKAIEAQDWTLAVEEINGALEKKADSGARVRSYGMNVTSYFPYLKLGVAYYHLGQLDAALQAFETESRLGAIEQSETANAELERYRALVQEAQAASAAEEKLRIRQLAEQSLANAQRLEAQGLLDEAMAALDRTLAIAPDNVEAREVMRQIRARVAERELERERQETVSELVEKGRLLERNGQFSEASSVFRQALFLQPSAEVKDLLDKAHAELIAELENRQGSGERDISIGARLEKVLALESAGQFTAAMDNLQSVLVLEPSNPEAQTIQNRLLQSRRTADMEIARQSAIERLLAEAVSRFEDGMAEDSLSAANRVLALDPGNDDALEYIALAYAMISRDLLGTTPRRNIPPAVRFVDLRQESDDGVLIQTVESPEFHLNGVIIDNSPVVVVFYDSDDQLLETNLNSQPLGEFFLTEFNVATHLTPGLSTFRLVATDSENLVSSSEYAVNYARPIVRAPWFYVLLLGGSAALLAVVLWRRARQREQLRQRRFNPYVAGAPVIEDDMFFGRRELVDRILQTIHNNSLLIYGERRIGKTSIQHQIKKRLRGLDDPTYEFHPVYIDLQGTPETRFFQTIAEDIFQELAPVLNGLTPEKDMSGEYSYRDFLRDLRVVLKRLSQRTPKKVKLVLLIDEVDELNDYDPRINQKLRSLFMKSFAENLVAVVSGVEIKKHWEREGSPWYNFFEEIEVQALQPQDARDLIERPINKVFKLDRGAVERIIALSGGKPYLIQKICVALVTRLHEQHRRKITVTDVDAVDQFV